MTQIEKFCDRELTDLRDLGKNLCLHKDFRPIKDLIQIALIEINRELDERKIKREGRG